MKIGIDLLWVKVGKVGGTESYIRNLLDGFYNFANESKFSFVLFLAKDNHYSFDKYVNKSNFRRVILPVKSEKVYLRIIKENLLLDKYAEKEEVDLMFIPVYSKPLFKSKKIPYIIAIHDLQALHYPEYFSRHKYLWLKFAWKRCAKTSDKIVAISNFVKKDIAEKLDIPLEKISVIYNPITGLEKIAEFEAIKDKYDITKKGYYYTVSSLFPHKNLKTLLYVIKKLKDENSNVSKKLLISGIGGKSKNEIVNLISKLDIEKEVVLTGFISNEERNSLYKNAKIFLFPSIFEGFGMPPIEAMMLGTPVITTKLTSIPEVTQRKAYYVEDPYSVDEWVEKIKKVNLNGNTVNISFKEYDIEVIVSNYIKLFSDLEIKK